jgi:hypothetical protein
MAKQQLIVLDKIDPNQLPELANFKERGTSLLKECPFVKVEDNSTYEVAKKHRTALKTYRTDVQKSEKAIKDKINSFKTKVQNVSAELIQITQPAEIKQQSEIDVWEEKKEQERLEKLRLEQERIDGIKNSILDFYDRSATIFRTMKFQDIEKVKSDFEKEIESTDKTLFEEFEVLFDSKISELYILLDQMISVLKREEENRLAELEIENKKKEMERIDSIKKSIDDWHQSWQLKIADLTFSYCENVFKNLINEKPLDCQEFASVYSEKRSLLISKFEEKIALLKKAEEDRIALEEQKRIQELEAKKLEEQKLNLRFEQRKFELSKIGVLEFDQEMIKAISDEAFEVYLENCKPKPIEEIEVVEPIEFEQLNIIDEQPVFELQDEIQEVEFEETWNNIFESYKDLNFADEYDSTELFVNWLEQNYNVPTRKNGQ